MKRWLPDWVSEYKDRHGKPRYRFRRKGFAPYTFKSRPGTEGFRQEYEACKSGISAPVLVVGEERHGRGTFNALLVRYYRSPEFLDTGDRTQVVYRGVLDRWAAKYGECLVKDLETRHVADMIAEMLPHRTAANMLRKRLRALMAFAVSNNEATINPVLNTKPFKVKTQGFHTWSEEEIALYEARHPIGSKARLALDLMLWTGQRGGDARLMGPGHIRGKRLIVTQEKTGVTVSLPLLAPLAESILATPSGGLVFLLSEHGKPFSRKGFGNKMRQWCDEAGLPDCSAHGLRKAASRRFAEAGCSNQQIKAWTGHTTDSEVSRYTAAAEQQLLSDSAAEMLMANLQQRLANANDNALGIQA